jgi:hypothetical protein
MNQKAQAIAAFLLAQDKARAMFAEAVEGVDKLGERLQIVGKEVEKLKQELEAENIRGAAVLAELQQYKKQTEPTAAPEIHEDPAA